MNSSLLKEGNGDGGLALRLLAQAEALEGVDTLPRHHRDTQAEIDAAAALLREAAAAISRALRSDARGEQGMDKHVARFIQRGPEAVSTLAMKAREAAKGNDWVVPVESIPLEEIVAVANALSSPALPGVTDEMVEMACEAWNPELTRAVREYPADGAARRLLDRNRKLMRAALTAALSPIPSNTEDEGSLCK